MTLVVLLLSFITFGSVVVYSSQYPFVPLSGLQAWNPVQASWAQYSPYSPVAPYEPPLDGCAINQVNLIQRHGARYPTSGAGKDLVKVLKKLKKADHYKSPKLDFLKNYTYDLGVDDLVSFGASQSFDAGREFFTRYQHLVHNASIPFVRASGLSRVILSATNWTAGFAAASDGRYTPALDLILPEKGNDTLDDGMCPNVGKSSPQKKEWLSVSATAVKDRLNKDAPGANLNSKNVYSLMSLCPFETVANEKLSPFCDIFTDEEFEIFEYTGDLDKYYGTGYGQELGPVQGVGYVNELIARLTGMPVSDHTQTNTTLDSSPTTFPLDRALYADFSHDNQMIAIYSAMGLFKQPEPLNTTSAKADRTWLASELVPFSARMVTEKLSCYGRQFVRIFVNDAMQSLEFCGAGKDGMCTLEDFVASQVYARNDGDGDFEKCFN